MMLMTMVLIFPLATIFVLVTYNSEILYFPLGVEWWHKHTHTHTPTSLANMYWHAYIQLHEHPFGICNKLSILLWMETVYVCVNIRTQLQFYKEKLVKDFCFTVHFRTLGFYTSQILAHTLTHIHNGNEILYRGQWKRMRTYTHLLAFRTSVHTYISTYVCTGQHITVDT